MKILMVLTSHDQLGNTGRKTGFWLEEFAAPYFVFKDADVAVTLASPKGAPNWQSFVITDGRLITGQNPASSTAAAKALFKVLSQTLLDWRVMA